MFFFRFSRLICSSALVALLAIPAYAAPETPTSAPNTPAQVVERKSPVNVVFEGTDSIGARLSTRLKELFNASNLFTLTGQDGPKFQLFVTTSPEFSTRPEVGSAYSVVWLFGESESHLRFFLTQELGVLSPGEINDVAAKIVERTDGVAVRYGYLIKK